MGGLELTIDVAELMSLSDDLQGIADRAQDFTVPMKVAAIILMDSVVENFQAGGRPEPWAALADSTLLAKAPKTAILINSGDLFDSLTPDSGSDFARVSTVREYAAVHQLGHKFDKTVTVPAHDRHISQAFGKPIKPKTVHVKEYQMRMNTVIPARPFMLVQDEDMEDSGAATMDYLLGMN